MCIFVYCFAVLVIDHFTSKLNFPTGRPRARTIYIFNTGVCLFTHRAQCGSFLVAPFSFYLTFSPNNPSSFQMNTEIRIVVVFSIFSLFFAPVALCSFSYSFIVIFALVDVRAPRNVGGRLRFLVCFVVFVLVLVIVMLVVLNCTMKTCMQSLHFKLVPFVSHVCVCECMHFNLLPDSWMTVLFRHKRDCCKKRARTKKERRMESSAWYALAVCYTLNHFYGFLFASYDCP